MHRVNSGVVKGRGMMDHRGVVDGGMVDHRGVVNGGRGVGGSVMHRLGVVGLGHVGLGLSLVLHVSNEPVICSSKEKNEDCNKAKIRIRNRKN